MHPFRQPFPEGLPGVEIEGIELVIVAADCSGLIDKHLKENSPKEYLFEGQYGGQYSTTSIRNVLKKAKRLAGVTT